MSDISDRDPVSRLDDETERVMARMIQFASEHGTPSTKKVSIGECATCRETAAALRSRIRELIEEARAEGVYMARSGINSMSVCPVSGDFSITPSRGLKIDDGYAECERCHARLISPTTGMLSTDRCYHCHGQMYAFPKPDAALSTPAKPLHDGGLGRTEIPYGGETTIPGRRFPNR